MNLKERLRLFFFPPPGSPKWMLILPVGIVLILGFGLLAGGTYGWEYTNSPQFCGPTCHTMPPQDETYKVSPHANVYCTECHIGRAFIGEQFARKSEDVREIYAMVFNTYEFPIRATRSRPARETCEKCHQPETFSDDSLRTITHFADDQANTPTSTYLIMKTGGGAKREGLGLGIHWHIVNQVSYYATDDQKQEIPFVRVFNEDGSTTDYLDLEAGFDPATIDETKLDEVECTTCHNRVTHEFKNPSEAMDTVMARGLLASEIPFIHKNGVEILSVPYPTTQAAQNAIADLEKSYQNDYPDYYAQNSAKIKAAVAVIQKIYSENIFPDQKVNWETHANNLGHMQTAGCFRCHDGKHLNDKQEAIRLECNLCHSIPTVANQQDFITKIEISRGPEPDSHRNANWINLHNKTFDATCVNCHTTEGAGGTSNTSFCSNSACHGNVYTYAGFDAPKLREILQLQLPTSEPPATSVPLSGAPTFENIGPLFSSKCTMCHTGAGAPGGLNLSTYADVIKGGKDGPVITANDSTNSPLVITQDKPHFANLTADELKLVKAWIEAGALEK
jgi:hypothetical protein